MARFIQFTSMLTLIAWTAASAQITSDVTNTAHNLSISGTGTVRATTEDQVCVFCHTPHKAANIPDAPLWNRQDSTLTATYTPYTSSSIDANDIAATPGGSSKLCLSCHDGTIAIGSVNVANGQENVTFNMLGTAGGNMPGGPSGETSGFTRKIGTDLRNDHPISFTYNTTVANLDGELRDPALEAHIGNRSTGVKPLVPLENDQMQCTSCHDPHIRDVDLAKNIKFLRLNRFQEGASPTGGAFNETNDIICLACHDKLGLAWAQSAHADENAADELYTTAAANLRDFPANTQVWQASCLNCHDTHTVQGARRLLREGTDSTNVPKTGGNPALEETCYTCHSVDGGVLVGQGTATSEVPDVKTDFETPGNTHMPINSADQNAPNNIEIHDIQDADLSELQANFNNSNRHVECTDCHNPHRVMKNRLFNGTGTPVAGTHNHASGHTNIASGVLRGSWGVEPQYTSDAFDEVSGIPSLFLEKKGDGGAGASTDINSTYVTREYQICFKCHSNYAYGTNPPLLGSTGGNTGAPQANGLTQYTNQAMEFQAPTTHQGGQTSATPSGADSAFTNNNHRSWHPVMDATGRNLAARGTAQSGNWHAPFNGAANIGTQTMYCSDCHGSNVSAGNSSTPDGGENGNAWGPHGSSNKFILKGQWNAGTGNGQNNAICFKCHDRIEYATENTVGDNTTGFCCGGKGNLHADHMKSIGRIRCTWCHVAVPHGWKNKAFLVNLNDVGPESTINNFTTTGNEVSNAGGYDDPPYYLNAKLKIVNFRNSGTWREQDCGSTGGQGGQGRDWMRNTCENPP